MLRRMLIATNSTGGGSVVDQILALSPLVWARCDDNASTSAILNSGSVATSGTFYSAVTGSSLAAKNTSTASVTGLATGTTRALNLSGGALIAMPNVPISSHVGWTFFGIFQPLSVPPTSGIAALFQLTDTGSSCPEIDINNVDGSRFKLRVMASGTSEVTMTATPTFAYGSRLAIAAKLRANGVLDVFVNGSLVASSVGVPPFSYGSAPLRFGGAVFGGTNYYALPGLIDEAAVWGAPLTDAQCISLTTAGNE